MDTFDKEGFGLVEESNLGLLEENIRKILVTQLEKDIRADIYLAQQLDISRSNMQKLMNNGLVLVKDKPIKQNYRIKGNETFFVEYEPPQPLKVEAEDIAIDIVYEDSDMIVVNKARGMVVHPAPGHDNGTLVNALLFHCKDLSGINGIIRPGIVHRLDKDTSGVMVVAKNDNAHVDLASQIKNKTATRKYFAIVHGYVKTDEGRIETLIGRDLKDRQKMAVVDKNGRESITLYKVVERFKEHTLVECKLLTGRTHQIRVHMSYIGHPLVGDPKYMTRKHGFTISGQALHSHKLSLTNLAGEKMSFDAPLPADMEKILIRLRR